MTDYQSILNQQTIIDNGTIDLDDSTIVRNALNQLSVGLINGTSNITDNTISSAKIISLDAGKLTGTIPSSTVATDDITIYHNGSDQLAIAPTYIDQALTSLSDVSFRDLTLSGDLTVNGIQIILDAATLTVSDNILILSYDNIADTWDSGFMSKYVEGATTYYTGLIRDASDSGIYKLIEKTTDEPGFTANISNLGVLKLEDVITDNGYLSDFYSTFASYAADLDGFPDELKNLTTAEIQQLENIGTSTISSTQWGYLSSLNQSLTTNDAVEFDYLSLKRNQSDLYRAAQFLHTNTTDLGWYHDIISNRNQFGFETGLIGYNLRLNTTGTVSGEGKIEGLSNGAQVMGGGLFIQTGNTHILSKYQSSAVDLDYTWSDIAKISIKGTNGFVGINNVSPNYQLDINGNANITGDLTISGTVDSVDVLALYNQVQVIDGDLGEFANLTTAEIQQLENIDTTTISATQWGYLGSLDQSLTSSDSVIFADTTIPLADAVAQSNGYVIESANLANTQVIYGAKTGATSTSIYGCISQSTTEYISVGSTNQSSAYLKVDSTGIKIDYNSSGSFPYGMQIKNDGTGGAGIQYRVAATTSNYWQHYLTAANDMIWGRASLFDAITINGTNGAITTSGAVNGLTTAQFSYLDSIGNDVSATQWGYLGSLDQSLTTTDDPQFIRIDLTQSIGASGNRLMLANTNTTGFSVISMGQSSGVDNNQQAQIHRFNSSWATTTGAYRQKSFNIRNSDGPVTLLADGLTSNDTIEFYTQNTTTSNLAMVVNNDRTVNFYDVIGVGYTKASANNVVNFYNNTTNIGSVGLQNSLSGYLGINAVDRFNIFVNGVNSLTCDISNNVSIPNNLTVVSGNLTVSAGALAVAGDGSFNGDLIWNIADGTPYQRPLFMSGNTMAINVSTSYVVCYLTSEGYTTNNMEWQVAPRNLVVTHIHLGQDEETTSTTYDVRVEVGTSPPTVDTTYDRTGISFPTATTTNRSDVADFTIPTGTSFRISVKANIAGAVSEEVWVRLEAYY